MFNMSGQQPNPQRSSLHPLDLSHESMLLPAHQISPSSSIGSNSSGPSSPTAGPFTPPSAMISHAFSQLSTSNDSPYEPQSHELDLQMEMQLQQDYASYSWQTNAMWPSNTELLLSDDFDLSAIPPIELGMPKYSEVDMLREPSSVAEFNEYSQAMEAHHNSENQGINGLLGFDQLMAGHGF
jgi:hypothetical protein